MGVRIAFDYTAWKALFPEFDGSVSEPLAQTYFDIATTLHRNDGGGPVSSAAIQTTLLNYATAHLAALYSGTTAQPASPLVGRITNAAEGSVTVQTDYGTDISKAMAFWIQSKYGATYWAMTAPYRTMRYLPSQQTAFAGIWPIP